MAETVWTRSTSPADKHFPELFLKENPLNIFTLKTVLIPIQKNEKLQQEGVHFRFL